MLLLFEIKLEKFAIVKNFNLGYCKVKLQFSWKKKKEKENQANQERFLE